MTTGGEGKRLSVRVPGGGVGKNSDDIIQKGENSRCYVSNKVLKIRGSKYGDRGGDVVTIFGAKRWGKKWGIKHPL